MSLTFLAIGGNSGVGLATVRRLLADGHRVLAAAREAGPLAGLDVPFQRYDVLEPGPLELPSVLDGLVYFPGTITLKPFHRLGDEDFLEDFRVNCLGAVAAIRSALPALKAAPSASVVLFSTVAVAQGMPYHASISAAKGAVEGLARSLAAEFAPGIRVNVVAPSLMDTPLASTFLNTEAKRQGALQRHPLRRIGEPGDVAELVAYLLGGASRFMTGQVLHVDGELSSVRTF